MSDRSALARDVVTYNAKIWIAGLLAAIFVPLSLAALAVDLLLGMKTDQSLSRRVLETSAQIEASLDIHGDLTDVRVAAKA